jgi:glycosyltransferase involved in cell wall biosynthesis
MLYYVPLESLEERYTKQMYDWVIKALKKRNINYIAIAPYLLSEVTEGGQFLNWASRAYTCAYQNQMIAKYFHEGKIKNGDKFFIADFWHPGVEAIAYMAQMMDIEVEIYGINYAGPLDPTDLTHRLVKWGFWQEMAWYSSFTKVFVGSQFHKDTIIKNACERLRIFTDSNLAIFEANLDNSIIPTGLVWDEQSVLDSRPVNIPNPKYNDPRPIVIWPHRISPDKNIDGFYEIVRTVRQLGRQVRWLITSSRKGQVYEPEEPEVEFKVLTKGAYYEHLRLSAVMLSTAFHENFGYTVREATAFGTPVLVPERACYPEMVTSRSNRYATNDEAVVRLLGALNNKLPVATLKETRGIEHMLDEMGY